MAESKKNTNNDVAKPGTTPASATSKPVIVGHSSQIADPMVSASAQNPQPAAETPKPTAVNVPSGGSSKPKLAPISDQATIKKQAANEEDQSLAEKPIETTENVDEKAARIQEIIETQEYNVSISERGNKGKNGLGTFLTTVLTVLIVGFLILYLLAYLKIIDTGIKLPFEIFKN